MGLDRYVARYTAVAHDDSTAGNIRACDAYARCRRSLNDAQARTLSPARQAQVMQVRRSLDALAGASYEYTYLSDYGGTMWAALEAGDHAAREDFLAALIADLRRPFPSSPRTRRQADVALRSARRSLAGMHALQGDSAATMDRALLRQYRSRTYPAAQAAFTQLTTLIALLPDVTARHVAREVRQELAAPARYLNP